MATTKRLNFNHGVAPLVELRYETDDDARVREYLRQGYFGSDNPQKSDEVIDEWLKLYHRVARARHKLGIK